MIALIERLDIQYFAFPDNQLTVTDDVLNLKACNGELLADARPAEEAAYAIGREKGFGRRFGTGYDEFTTREEQYGAVWSNQTERDGCEFPTVERRETENLFKPVQVQRC